MAETVDSIGPVANGSVRPIRVFVNGDLFNGALEQGTNVRSEARKAAQANGIVQYTVRVNNSPADLESTLSPGDILAIEATSTKG